MPLRDENPLARSSLAESAVLDRVLNFLESLTSVLRLGDPLKLLPIVLSLLLVSCVINPYTQFYQGMPDARVSPIYEPSCEPIQVFESDDFNVDVPKFASRGYAVVGSSAFHAGAGSINLNGSREQAKKIGAHIVLVSTKYAGTETGTATRTLYGSSTSNTQANVNAYGSGGWANASGSSQTQTDSFHQVLVPYSVDISDYGAVFLAKTRPPILGARGKPLDDETRHTLGTNTGLEVYIVIDGSPAFLANVLIGDKLLSVADEAVYEGNYDAVLKKYAGQEVALKLVRNGEPLIKTVHLNGVPPQVVLKCN